MKKIFIRGMKCTSVLGKEFYRASHYRIYKTKDDKKKD